MNEDGYGHKRSRSTPGHELGGVRPSTLVSRGDLTIWFDEATIKDGWTPHRRSGAATGPVFGAGDPDLPDPEDAVRLPHRATEGADGSR